MAKNKKQVQEDMEDVLLDRIEKREFLREKQRSYIFETRDAIETQLNAAEKAGDMSAVRRLKKQLTQCRRRMAVVDLRRSEDHLALMQVQLARLENEIKTAKDMSLKLTLMKQAEIKDNEVYEAQIGVRESKAAVARFETPKAKTKKTTSKKSAGKKMPKASKGATR